MKSILLIIPYFGKWPLWFDAYLSSVAANPSISWLCPTDCKIPKNHPENITFRSMSLSEINNFVNNIVEANVPLNPRKFCDLKPAYAEIFATQVRGYDFWGFCDMDIVWGDIRKFITDDILNEYDIISSRKENISGHFNLFRNTQQINSLYKKLPNYKILFEAPEFKWTDEVILSNFIKTDPAFSIYQFKVYWPSILCNQEKGRDSHQEYYLDRWLWKDGKMLELKNGNPVNEVMYLHFINWKRTMRYCEVSYVDHPEQFYISYNGMHYKKHSNISIAFNWFTNLFDGYYIRLKQRKARANGRLIMNQLKKVPNKFKYYLNKLKSELNFLGRNIKYIVSNKKKVIYVGCTDMGNLGDEAILVALRRMLQNYFHIYSISYAYPSDGEYFRKRFFKTPEYIILGGGTLIRKKRGESYLRLMLKLHKLWPKSRIATLGTGVVDPLFAESIGFALDKEAWKKLLNESDFISVRGTLSRSELSDWNLNKEVLIFHDPAIWFTRTEIKPKQKKKRIGLNFANIGDRIHGKNKKSIESFAREYIQKLQEHNWEIYLYPTTKSDMDYMLNEIGLGTFSGLHKYYNYSDIKSSLDFLESMDIFIGQRLHSIIFSATVATPFIALEYEPKTRDFLENMECHTNSYRVDELDINKIYSRTEEIYETIEKEQLNVFTNMNRMKKEQNDCLQSFLSNFNK